MPKAYSLDLRERIVRFVLAGHSRHQAAAHFGVSVSFAVNLLKAFQTSGRMAPKPLGGRRFSKLEPHRQFLLGRAQDKPDITMPELVTELAARGTQVAPASISRWFKRNNFTYKKSLAGERTRAIRYSRGSPRMD